MGFRLTENHRSRRETKRLSLVAQFVTEPFPVQRQDRRTSGGTAAESYRTIDSLPLHSPADGSSSADLSSVSNISREGLPRNHSGEEQLILKTGIPGTIVSPRDSHALLHSRGALGLTRDRKNKCSEFSSLCKPSARSHRERALPVADSLRRDMVQCGRGSA